MATVQSQTHSPFLIISGSCCLSSSSSYHHHRRQNHSNFPPRRRHLPQWTLFATATSSPLNSSFATHRNFKCCFPSIVTMRRRRKSKASLRTTTVCSSSPPPPPSSSNQPIEDLLERKSPDLRTLATRFWKVAAPYWFSDEDKVEARLQLAGVFALTLATTGISVGFSFLGRDFYNALANKDQEQFTKQLLYYLAAFAGGIPFFVLRDYARETLSLRWRSWMTKYYLDRYLQNQTFYKIQSQSTIDNPDQRIVDDLSAFSGTALSFSLTLFNAAVDLISFSNILYGIYPPLFVVLLAYSIGGSAISVFLGKGLVTLNFLQEKKEADFRFGLVRIRENAESIAFYGGEENEKQLLLQRFRSAFENLTQLLISSRNLEFFTNGYRYLIQILPAAVVAPMYFAGKIEFGVINQSVSAFNHILGDFSLIVYQFQAISAFSAVIDRLGEFDDMLDGSGIFSRMSDSLEEEIQLTYCNKHMSASLPLPVNGPVDLDNHQLLLNIDNLTLQTPLSKVVLIRNLSLRIHEKDHLLVTGPSGSGKTSLLRAVAGLWNTGNGEISLLVEEDINDSPQSATSPDGDVAFPLENIISAHDINEKLEPSKCRNYQGVFFLPQRPYMVLGTLRQQLLYPTWTEDLVSSSDNAKSDGVLPFLMLRLNSKDVRLKYNKPTTDDLVHVLEDVRLSYILSRSNGLDSICEWSSVLSLGEQQRLAFARVLLSKPYLVLLDESTSALDEANENLKTGKTIGGGHEKGGLYHFEDKFGSSTACSTIASTLEIHSRLGLPQLDKLKQLIPHLSHVKRLECESCQLGKHHRVVFPPRINKRAAGPFILNVWGPSRVTSKLGFRYFDTFVDDYYPTTWLYLMKNHSELFSIFCSFCAEIKTQFDVLVHIIRSDNAKEYLLTHFRDYMKQYDIIYQTSCSCTPQQNGVVER